LTKKYSTFFHLHSFNTAKDKYIAELFGLNLMTTAAIQVTNLSKHFDTLKAVDSISFSVKQGSTCALLGGNGAGKTTTLSMLLGLLLPSAGEITILSENMLRHRYKVLPRMNFTSPYVDVPRRLTVAENLTIYARLYGLRKIKPRLRELSEQFDLAALMKRTYGSLSAGQKTRVSVAKSLINEPEVLLLDEPTASLDPDTADHVRKYLCDYQKRKNATMLLASHNMVEVERMCDDVIMLREGCIVDSGTPASLIQRYGRENMEEVFLDIARYQDRAKGLNMEHHSS
jgi:ABC-2 type transport system ATP-binding protein